MSFNQVTDQQFSTCDGLLLAKLTNKISIAIDPNDYNGRIVYLFGTNEPRIQAVIQALLSPGDRFLDIGANYSSIGLSAINSIGLNGQIHLFEPQPEICQSVEKAIKTARLTNVFLHEVALMNYDGDKQLIRPKNHSGKGTLLAEYGNQEEWDTITVSVRNIQDYVPPLV
ncbi:MAG: FkbM family methyltransferase, partial [Halothece sp. Uz-M2-17]|nr:FkbM family methyltransferase [Halothece sp. Uz-M2-17]